MGTTIIDSMRYRMIRHSCCSHLRWKSGVTDTLIMTLTGIWPSWTHVVALAILFQPGHFKLNSQTSAVSDMPGV